MRRYLWMIFPNWWWWPVVILRWKMVVCVFSVLCIVCSWVDFNLLPWSVYCWSWTNDYLIRLTSSPEILWSFITWVYTKRNRTLSVPVCLYLRYSALSYAWCIFVLLYCILYVFRISMFHFLHAKWKKKIKLKKQYRLTRFLSSCKFSRPYACLCQKGLAFLFLWT